MKAVPSTRLHVERMANGLSAVIDRNPNPTKALAAASVGKLIALGGSVVPGWTFILGGKPSFLSRAQRISRRAYEITNTAAHLGCLSVVDFIPEETR